MIQKEQLENKIYEKQSYLFNQSQQTTYGEVQDNHYFTSPQTSDKSDESEDDKQKQITQNLKPLPNIVNKDHSDFLCKEQISKNRFSSISKIYEDQMSKKYQQNSINIITLNNYFLKCKKKNIERKTKIISIIQKLISPRRKKRFNEIKEMIEKQKIQQDRIIPLEINFFKCQCHFITISRKSFLMHLKHKSHKAYLCIQTEKQRRNQQKLYKTLSSNGQLDFFDSSWLYKSFQIIFVQGGIHYSLHSINHMLLKQINGFKIQQENNKFSIFTNSIHGYFKKKWKQIYVNLHQFHNGNQRNRHKCFNIDQHLSIFALGLIHLIEKNIKFYESQEGKAKFQMFSQFMNVILLEFENTNLIKQIKIEKSFQKFCQYQSVRKLVMKLLKNYFLSFDYIDLNEHDMKQNI